MSGYNDSTYRLVEYKYEMEEKWQCGTFIKYIGNDCGCCTSSTHALIMANKGLFHPQHLLPLTSIGYGPLIIRPVDKCPCEPKPCNKCKKHECQCQTESSCASECNDCM